METIGRVLDRAARILLVAGALAGALVFTGAASAAAPTFVLTGRGYGHGIGMSQYGAQGYAQNGWAYQAILAHYYPGTTLATDYPNSYVDVLVADARASLTLVSTSAFTLGDSAAAAGTYTLTPRVGKIHVVGPGISSNLASPLTATPGGAALSLDGIAYRGTLAFASTPDGTKISALNTLRIESYLRGVVPREMPASWEPAALRVQAVAARTYALATSGHCTWLEDPVYCSGTADQVYGGKSAETDTTDDAVAATKGEVVTYGGDPITAYFFSTSGGKTAAIADEWGGAPVPYLISVDDPYDTISPHHFWGPADAEIDCPGTSPDCVFGAAAVQSALGLPSLPTDLEVTARNSSSRVATLLATTGSGTTAFSGTTARTKLGLRSTWFSVGALSIRASQTTIVYGSQTALSGLARSGGTRGWGAAWLQRKGYDESTWTPVTSALPDGDWARTRKPPVQTAFRVASGNAASVSVTIRVRTRVTLTAATARKLKGSVSPARAGTIVTLERRKPDGSWAFVARKTLTATGTFTFTVTRGGTYRARADAGAGLLEGSATASLP